MRRLALMVSSALLAGLVSTPWAAPSARLAMSSAWAQSAAPPQDQAPLIDPSLMDPTNAAATDDDALRDIKPLRPARAVRWPWFLLAALVALALGAALWWWRRRRQAALETADAKRRVRPPHEVALLALKALHKVNFADEAAVRQYYFAISEVLRAYVTARFDLTASTLTTEEIFSRLPRLVELAPPENLRLRAFLAQTDQVKYALHQATPEEIGATHEQAIAFIEATLQKAVEPAAAHPPTSQEAR